MKLSEAPIGSRVSFLYETHGYSNLRNGTVISKKFSPHVTVTIDDVTAGDYRSFICDYASDVTVVNGE